MKRASVNGVELEYELIGSGEPVLLIHGSHLAGSYLPLVAQPALQKKCLLIRYHRRGFLGSSSPTGPVSMEDQAADAAALLKHLGIPAAHVVGHSYGGAIGLQMAHDFPAHVHSLVLLEAPLPMEEVPGGKETLTLVAAATRLYEAGNWEVAIDMFLGGPGDRVTVARNIPGGLEQAIRDMDTYFMVEAPAHDNWRFTAAEGRRIKQPVLFVLGAESSKLYVHFRDLIKQWMPQTETAVLPRATHLLHVMNPEGAAEILLDFVARHQILSQPEAAERDRAPRAFRVRDRYNAAVDLLDQNLEQGRGYKTAILTPSDEWTYGEVAAGACRLGNGLLALGLESENRVLMAVLDTPEFATTFFGTIKAGGVPVPVNTNLTVDEYAYMLDDSQAKFAVVSQPLADVLRQARRKVRYPKHLVVIGQREGDELSFDMITRHAQPELTPADTTRDDMCFWLYSSGTTGTPKAVVHLQHDMRYCVDTYARTVLGLTPADVLLSASKLYFAYGLGNGLYFPLGSGATTILIPSPPTPRVLLDAIGRFRPTIYFAIPTSYANTLATSGSSWGQANFDSVRMCVSAGEPLAASILERWKERTGRDILDGIGTTECCHTFISNRVGSIRPNCSGTVVEGYEARIADESGRDLPAGEPGVLLVRGDSICAGYWREHELTQETILGHWLKTGDIYTRDESGYFYYQGRSDDMLKVGGIWVSPHEVESVLAEHDSVVECAVVGVPDQDGLIRPEAFVVVARPARERELVGALRQHVRQRLGGNKTPRAFHLLESLPKTTTGKIQRFKLREQALLLRVRRTPTPS